jgi:hypothetical protein
MPVSVPVVENVILHATQGVPVDALMWLGEVLFPVN